MRPPTIAVMVAMTVMIMHPASARMLTSSEAAPPLASGSSVRKNEGGDAQVLFSCEAFFGITCNNCFPGDAMVQLESGDALPMAKLAVGDKVAVQEWNSGKIAYDDVYAFGHNDPFPFSPFVKITVELTSESPDFLENLAQNSSRILEISAGHFVPTLSKSGVEKETYLYKRAADIKLGDYIWASTGNRNGSGDSLLAHIVTDVSTTVKRGLYNPYTMRGTIVVGGVVASVHSDWFLDSFFDALGLTHLLPPTYQGMLSLARGIYKVLGKEAYVGVYNWLDTHINLVALSRNYGGSLIILLMTVMPLLLIAGASVQGQSRDGRLLVVSHHSTALIPSPFLPNTYTPSKLSALQ